MVSPTAENVARIEMKYLDSNGQNMSNVFHAHDPAGWDYTKLTALAGGFVSWWDTELSDLACSAVSLVQVVATDLTSLAGARAILTLTTPSPGTITDPLLPNNVTVAIEQVTAVRGRGVQGRYFMPGLAESQVSGDFIDGTVLSNIIAASDALLTILAALDGSPELVVLHRVVGGVKLLAQTWDAVQRFAATDRTIDSMRTRLPNHKKHKRKVVSPIP